ncbi:hypothetical protein Lal_00008066 [Lupinus albus]|nr:hypothetical protein Lal_00008066 [Lupinus albus]
MSFRSYFNPIRTLPYPAHAFHTALLCALAGCIWRQALIHQLRFRALAPDIFGAKPLDHTALGTLADGLGCFPLDYGSYHSQSDSQDSSTAIRSLTGFGSLSLPSRGAFHLSLTVLCAIGRQKYFALESGLPCFPQGFSCLVVLWIPAILLCLSLTGLLPSAVYLSRCFSSPGALLILLGMGDGALPPPGSPIRIFMDHCLLAAPHDFSELTPSFFGFWRLGIHLFKEQSGLPSLASSPVSFNLKEVIQPHLPIRLPCYDFTPIIGPTFDGWLLAVTPPASGVSNSRGVTGGELQPAIRTESLFIGVRSASRLRFPLFKPIVVLSHEFPPLRAGNIGQGLRSLRDLTQHLTTRADDSHAPPVFTSPEGEGPISKSFAQCQALVRFFALRRIKPHTPPLVRAPVNSFEFQPCGRTPQAGITGVSNPVHSPGFRASASDTVQKVAFATGVPPNIYAFHRYTGNSTFLSCTQDP